MDKFLEGGLAMFCAVAAIYYVLATIKVFKALIGIDKGKPLVDKSIGLLVCIWWPILIPIHYYMRKPAETFIDMVRKVLRD